MNMTVRVASLLSLAVALSAQPDASACKNAPKVAFPAIENRVAHRPKIERTGIAAQLDVQGVAEIELCLSPTGEVLQANILKAHPLLVEDAVRTAKAYRFGPADSGTIKTVLTLDFQTGTPAENAARNKAINNYFAAQERCRDALGSGAFAKATQLCATAAALAEKLPPARQNERRLAYGQLSQAHFFHRNSADALAAAQKEVAIAEATMTPDQGEYGYAHYHAATAYHSLGRAADAARHYATAEKALMAARLTIELEAPKASYTATLKRVRENYLKLLSQTGDTATAADVQKRLQSEK